MWPHSIAPFRIVRFPVAFPLPDDEWCSNHSSGTNTLQDTAKSARSLCHHLCDATIPNANNDHGPIYSYTIFITIPNAILLDILPADKVGEFSKEICLELNIIGCRRLSSLLVANIDFLEASVAVKEAVKPVHANNIWRGGWWRWCLKGVLLPLVVRVAPPSKVKGY